MTKETYYMKKETYSIDHYAGACVRSWGSRPKGDQGPQVPVLAG